MNKHRTLLLVVLLLAAVSTGVGLASATDHSNGWQSCANAPTVGEGPLTVVPETAIVNAAEGVTNARSKACGESAQVN